MGSVELQGLRFRTFRAEFLSACTADKQQTVPSFRFHKWRASIFPAVQTGKLGLPLKTNKLIHLLLHSFKAGLATIFYCHFTTAPASVSTHYVKAGLATIFYCHFTTALAFVSTGCVRLQANPSKCIDATACFTVGGVLAGHF